MMIDKKLKGVNDGIALPTVVAATAAVGQAQASGVEKKPPDISGYDNLSMSLDHWTGVSANLSELLQQLERKEKAARAMLGLSDCPAHEKRTAESVLLECAGERTELVRREDVARRQLAQIKANLEPMVREVERQRKLRSMSAAMR